MTKSATLSAKQIKTIEKLSSIAAKHQLDSIEVEGIKITKSRHFIPETKSQSSAASERSYTMPAGVTKEMIDHLIDLNWSALP